MAHMGVETKTQARLQSQAMERVMATLMRVSRETQARLQSRGYFFRNARDELLDAALKSARSTRPPTVEALEDLLEEVAGELDLPSHGGFRPDALKLRASWRVKNAGWHARRFLYGTRNGVGAPMGASQSMEDPACVGAPSGASESSENSEERELLRAIEEMEGEMALLSQTSNATTLPRGEPVEPMGSDEMLVVEDCFPAEEDAPTGVMVVPEGEVAPPAEAAPTGVSEVAETEVASPEDAAPTGPSEAVGDARAGEAGPPPEAEGEAGPTDPSEAVGAMPGPTGPTGAAGDTPAEEAEPTGPSDGTMEGGGAAPTGGEAVAPPEEEAAGPARTEEAAPTGAGEDRAMSYHEFTRETRATAPVTDLPFRAQFHAVRALWHNRKGKPLAALEALNKCLQVCGLEERAELPPQSMVDFLTLTAVLQDAKPGCPRCRNAPTGCSFCNPGRATQGRTGES